MSGKTGKGDKQPLRISPKRVLYVIGFFALALYLVVNTTNHLMGRALMIAFGDVETVYRSAWVSWNGDITAKGIEVFPYDEWEEQPTGTVRFDEARLQTPGLHWVLFQSFTSLKFGKFDRRKNRGTSHMDQVHLILTGIHSDDGSDPTVGDLGPLGALTASPFEALGCRRDDVWVGDDLIAMGLSPGPSQLGFDYLLEGNRLTTTISLNTPGVGSAIIKRNEQITDGPKNALMIDQTTGLVQSEQWHLSDQGFIDARNAYCAKQESISTEQFVRRHLQSVERWLAIAGLQVDASTRQRYAVYARSGGELDIDIAFNPALSTDDMYRQDEEYFAMLMRTTRVQMGDHQQMLPIVLTQISPQELPGYTDGDQTLWQALEAERGHRPERVAELATRAASLTAAAAAPANTTPAATPAAQPQSASAGNFESAGSTSSMRISQASLEQPKIVAIGGGPTRHQELSWSELAGFVGQPIRIWTRHAGARTVELKQVQADRLRVVARVGGGKGEYSVFRRSLIRAETVDQG